MKCLIAAAVGLVLIGPVAEANAEAFLCVGRALRVSAGRTANGRCALSVSRTGSSFCSPAWLMNTRSRGLATLPPATIARRCGRLTARSGFFAAAWAIGFSFSSRTLRFQENYGIGYVDAANGSANMPYLLIGKCTKLDLRGILQE